MKLTARQAIASMQNAIESKNKKDILNLYSPDNLDILPDWHNEPDYIWEEWQGLIEKAEQILGI